ncbi:MAG: FAD-binding oxidoreductase, partial [Actinomycetota bacterium]
MTDALAGLAGELDDGLLVTDPQVVAAHAGDQVPGLGSGTPLALVRPRTTQDVATVLRWASAHGVPVVPRGAGSGLAGAANAVDGAVVVSLAAMDRVLEVNPADRYVVVQPGAVTAAVDAAARAHGLSYPPDPASKDFSTIGGNIATNAGGLCCVKYGVTADFVLALEVVLADGSIVRTGHRTRKGVAGYDLTHLMVGSEGTLGVVTEATLRLVPAPLAAATLVAFFPTLESA